MEYSQDERVIVRFVDIGGIDGHNCLNLETLKLMQWVNHVIYGIDRWEIQTLNNLPSFTVSDNYM